MSTEKMEKSNPWQHKKISKKIVYKFNFEKQF